MHSNLRTMTTGMSIKSRQTNWDFKPNQLLQVTLTFSPKIFIQGVYAVIPFFSPPSPFQILGHCSLNLGLPEAFPEQAYTNKAKEQKNAGELQEFILVQIMSMIFSLFPRIGLSLTHTTSYTVY